jgi:hypothetical protein
MYIPAKKMRPDIRISGMTRLSLTSPKIAIFFDDDRVVMESFVLGVSDDQFFVKISVLSVMVMEI